MSQLGHTISEISVFVSLICLCCHIFCLGVQILEKRHHIEDLHLISLYFGFLYSDFLKCIVLPTNKMSLIFSFFIKVLLIYNLCQFLMYSKVTQSNINILSLSYIIFHYGLSQETYPAILKPVSHFFCILIQKVSWETRENFHLPRAIAYS